MAKAQHSFAHGEAVGFSSRRRRVEPEERDDALTTFYFGLLSLK